MAVMADQIAVWLVDNRPVRLVWSGIRYRVSDTPTPLEESLYALTHLPEGVIGWRFQGTRADGVTHMFDILQRGNAWELVRVFD